MRGRELAVIGAGQLGRRHLQGLLGLEDLGRIHVVDPVPSSLEAARVAAAEVAGGAEIVVSETIAALPRELDYAVVATSADARLAVLEELLPGRRVGGILLEKVLFQHVDDYGRATSLLDDAGTPAWVDCPRRAWPVYGELAAFFADDEIRHLEVRGGEWGLACNAVHFLDLTQFLTGATPSEVDPDGLDPTAIPAKRPGFFEFTGTLRAVAGPTSITLASRRDSVMPVLLIVRGERRSAIIDEGRGIAFLGGEEWREIPFRVPFISELSGDFARSVLETGTAPVAAFAESVQCHVPLLEALARHSQAALGTEPGFAPIT